MFFGKRKSIEADTQELMKQVETQLEKVSESLGEGQKIQEQGIKTLEGFGTDLKRHDMSLEDLLDEWSEKKSDEKEIKEQIRCLKDTEEKLLKLFEIYQEQFWAIHHMASELGDEWKKQMELIVRNTENQIRLCGISPVDEEAGKKVDYAVHEVLEVIETQDSQKDQTVAAVYRPGYVYRGSVRKKAQVAAFRYKHE